MGHGMKAFSKTSIACRRGCIDMREAHFHIKRGIIAYAASYDLSRRGRLLGGRSSQSPRLHLQRQRSFPMPEYDLSERGRVKVRIIGKVIDEKYSHRGTGHRSLGFGHCIRSPEDKQVGEDEPQPFKKTAVRFCVLCSWPMVANARERLCINKQTFTNLLAVLNNIESKLLHNDKLKGFLSMK